jgi:hypothetical protein
MKIKNNFRVFLKQRHQIEILTNDQWSRFLFLLMCRRKEDVIEDEPVTGGIRM